MHVILAVTDQGTPPLTRYQRVILTVQPSAAPPVERFYELGTAK